MLHTIVNKYDSKVFNWGILYRFTHRFDKAFDVLLQKRPC